MREIKFRAWQKENKAMWYDGGHMDLSLQLEGGLFTPDSYYGDDHDEGFVLMQYTGLHDKNSAEIFEGDIVSKRACNSREYIPYVIVFANYEWYFCVAQKTMGYLSHYPDLSSGEAFWFGTGHNHTINLNDIEVIGNIYENPELIKETK